MEHENFEHLWSAFRSSIVAACTKPTSQPMRRAFAAVDWDAVEYATDPDPHSYTLYLESMYLTNQNPEKK